MPNKYAYANSDEIQKEMFLLFSDQSMLHYTEKTKSKYKTISELLRAEEMALDDFALFQVQPIKWLIDRGSILESDNTLRVNEERVFVLRDLYEHEVICPTYFQRTKSVIEALIRNNDLRYGSTLFSEPEQAYLNYQLNQAEFSNGLDLRNKYNLWQFEDADGISLEILNLIVQKAIDDKTLEIVTKEVDCVHELIEAKEKLYYDDSVENIRSFANAILNCERSNSSVPTYFQTKNDAKPLVITDKGNRYFAIALDTEKAKSQKEAVDINMDIHYVLSLLFFNHNYDGIVIDPFSPVAMYLSKDFMLKVLVHGKYPDQHNGGVSEKNWGYGIPDYSADDLMTQGELLNFAMHLVIDHDLEKNGYRIVSACDNTNAVANIVAEKSGEYHLIAVTGYCAAETPVLSIERKLELLNLGDKYNAHCYYAPVGFRSATDLIRFNKCLALKGDGFYSKYEGLERIQ